MPNDFGALVDSTLIHDITDDLVEDIHPILGLARNLGEEQSDAGLIREARPGQTITIKDWSKPFTPYTVGAGGYIAPAYEAKDDITVTLPTAVTATSMALTAAEYRVLVGGPRKGVAYDELRKKINRMMMHGLKLKMAQDFMAIITSTNFTNATVSSVGTFTRSTEIDIDTELFDRKLMSRENATLLLPSSTFGEWSKDHIAVHTNTGAPQSARLMSGGQQSSVTPFRVWRTQVGMPAHAARGFAFTETAAILVQRIPDEPTIGDREPVSLATVVDGGTEGDPGSGLSFLFRLWKNPGLGQIQMDCATIYKFAKLQDEALERLTAA